MANASNCSINSDSAFEDEENNQPRYYFRNRNKGSNAQIKIELADEKGSSHEEFYPDTDSVPEKSSTTETSSVVISGSHNEAHNSKKINQEAPEVNKGNGYWTNQEIQYLKNWIKQHGLKFDKILAKYNMNDQQHSILSGRNRVSIAKKVKDLRRDGEIKKQGKIRYSRTPWKEEETNALEEGIKIYGKEWKKIIEDDKSKGNKSVLFKRDNIALKDKAKNEYNRRLKEKQPLGVYAIMKKRKRK
ncbi:hypothetical protein K502DRAFT_323581 [Neoconidiobolus thromboides FSU 785]|nr:hypothetical protein K502DRAFT_323581 [Neoconidiobolus thromboides FSU 785]